MSAHIPYPINDRGDYKAWCLRYDNAALLLREIIDTWRASNIAVPGKAGPWAVWPREHWVQKTGLSVDQVKRELRRLEGDGLILRERHTFAGKKVRSYLQPTVLALTYGTRPNDLARLQKGTAPTSAPISAPTAAPTSAPADALSLSLPFPSSSPVPPSSSVSLKTSSPSGEKGKEKVGEGESATKPGKITLVKKAISPEPSSTPHSPPPPKISPGDGDGEGATTAAAASAAELLAIDYEFFPEIPGSHKSKVKHPAKVNPDRWLKLSMSYKASLYAKYVAYVGNWQAAHKAPSSTQEAKKATELAKVLFASKTPEEQAEEAAWFKDFAEALGSTD